MPLELNGEHFTSGVATYFDSDPQRDRLTASIYVRVILPVAKREIEVIALLDTGTPYCIFNEEINEELGLDSKGEPRFEFLPPEGGCADRCIAFL